MGLSSFGSPIYSDLIEEKIFKGPNKFKLNLDFFNHTNKNFNYKFSGSPQQNQIFNNKIDSLFNLTEKNEKNFIIKQRNIASSIQRVFEKKLIQICEKIHNLDYSNNLVYAGGCALNSLANKKLFESKLFDQIYIPYAPGDAGGSIGSALHVIKSKNINLKLMNLQTPYIGPDFDSNEIGNELDNNKDLKKFNIT